MDPRPILTRSVSSRRDYKTPISGRRIRRRGSGISNSIGRPGWRGIIPRMATGPVSISESRILRAFAEKTPGSRALHNRAKALFPDGITHVGRFLDPFPIYVERASGSRKWDVDGNEYVDYVGGEGARFFARIA